MKEQFKRLYNSVAEKKIKPAPYSGYRYTPGKSSVQKSRKLFFLVGVFVAVSAALTGILYSLPFSLQDAGGIIKLSFVGLSASGQEDFSGKRIETQQEEPVLRGTIYDRNMEEMSVSYRLFSLFVRPEEIADRRRVAEQLASILGTDKDIILQRLQKGGKVELADDLDAGQAAALKQLHQPGIYCNPVEVRYYPGHSAAAHLLGFVSGKAGLSGVEALYDTVLQPGEFRQATVPSISFAGHDALGKTTTDVVLTLDMDLQKLLEQELYLYRKRKGALSGTALAMDPDTGRLLAMVSQPGFDSNYFWQADERKEKNAVFSPLFDREIIRPLVVQAAAIYAAGVTGRVLPITVSAPDYGLSEEQMNEYAQKFALERPVPNFLPVSLEQIIFVLGKTGESGTLSALQLGVGPATLLNSGLRVTPWLLNALYDHAEQRFFFRDSGADLRERIITPAAGINLRRRLFQNPHYSREDGFLFINSRVALTYVGGLSMHHIQDFLLAAAPKDHPKVLLVFAVDYGSLYPQPPPEESERNDERYRERNVEQDEDLLAAVGRRLLPILAGYGNATPGPSEPPIGKSSVNMRRYLFSRQLDDLDERKKYARVDPTMPQLIGLSLRKGLQLLNLYDVRVRIRGSGRITGQKPAAGEPLAETEICELILETGS